MQTKTYEDWSNYLGHKPNRLGVIARKYTDNTLNFITDGLKNTVLKDNKPSNFLLSNSMLIEYTIETNNIKKIEFAEVPSELGENGSEITMYFKERYLEMYDIARIDKSLQQFLVMDEPIRKRDDFWAYLVRLVDNNYDTVLDTDACLIGDTVTFQSNAHPELSDRGYSKFLSQAEIHRNYMTTFRNDISWSSLYALQEKVFMSICDDKEMNKPLKVYSMLKKEQELLDSFMYSMNTGLE